MYKHVCTLEVIYKLSSSAWLLTAAMCLAHAQDTR